MTTGTKTIDLIVGRRIASGRRRRGFTQAVLSREVGCSENWIRKLELGLARLRNLDLAVRISNVLGVDPYDLLAMECYRAEHGAESWHRPPAGAATGPPRTRPRSREEAVRGLLLAGSSTSVRELASLALEWQGPSGSVGAADPAPRRTSLDTETVRDVREAAARIRRMYRVTPANVLLSMASDQIDFILMLRLQTQPRDTWRQLVSALGEVAALTGVLLTLDFARPAEGRPYLDLALRAGRAVGSADLAATCYGAYAFASVALGELQEGIEYAITANEVCAKGASARTRAWTAAVASEMYANIGASEESRRAFDAARQALDGPLDDELWCGIGAFELSKLTAYEGGNLVRLGRYGSAVPVLDGALERLAPSMSRHRTAALLDKATALVGLREADSAVRVTVEALELAVSGQQAHAAQRVLGVYRQLARGGHSAARVLAERIMASKGSGLFPAAVLTRPGRSLGTEGSLVGAERDR